MTIKVLLAGSLILASSIASWWPLSAQEEEPAAVEAAAEQAAPRRTSTATEPPPVRSLDYFPAPLSTIRGDFREIEATGFLTIADVALKIQVNGDEAIVWTVRVNKAVTCRHIEQMLRQFRDVRFFATLDNSRQEIYTTVMHYSERVSLGTINKQLFVQDDQFEAWVPLDKTAQRRLVSFKADAADFRRRQD